MPQNRSLYAVKETGLCPACGFGRDSVSHFRLHIPRDRWPDSMRGKRVERVVIDGKVRPVGWVDPEQAVSREASPKVALMDVDHPRGTLEVEYAEAPLACPSCEYVAKTPHGLKVHIGRNHKE